MSSFYITCGSIIMELAITKVENGLRSSDENIKTSPVREMENGVKTVENGLGNGVGIQATQGSEKSGVAGMEIKYGAEDQSKILEIVCLSTVIFIAWELLTLPIIFFYLPVNSNSANDIGPANTTNSSVGCSSAFPYPTPGGICQTELESILFSMNCDSERIPLVLRDEESTARDLISSLEFLRPSDECREAVTPFLCLDLFGLCDSSGVSLQPTSGQCEDVRDRTCRTEWATALSLGVDLPDCESFPSEQASCPDQSGSGSGSGSTETTDENTAVIITSAQFPCREDFFRDEGSGLCVPSCNSWREYSDTEVIVTDVLILLSTVVGFIAGLAVLVISVISYKRMFSFPSVFIVCLTIDLVIVDFFTIVTYLDRPGLYCSSRNLIESIFNVTPFCVIAGMLSSYTLMQITLWWIFHTTSLFWTIFFPFNARAYRKSRRLKFVYALSIFLGIVIPLVPIVASMSEFTFRVNSDRLLRLQNATFASGGLGYANFRFPPILCTASSGNVVFYSLELPINIIVMVGVVELILLFWKIQKHHGLFKQREGKLNITIGTAERKILITLCYYMVLSVFSISAFTLATRNGGPFAEALFDHFTCESGGQDPDSPMRCDRNDFRQFSNPEVTAVVTILLSLFPIVNLVYALNIMRFVEKCRRVMCPTWERKTQQPSTANTNI